ncbi:MAG: FAD-dependent oxidoreductase, partial [Gallionella sp.]|nr:FAD-dependent oxidoreductase [Gallionella sp.]
MTKKRTGVFVCHCGTNIAATVDVAKVAREMADEDTVAFTQEYVYMCSEPGQESVVQAIKDNKLDSVVVTCCSPSLHEKTFRDNAKRAGINNFTCEIANIREQCSWVHSDKAKGTEKAIKISRSVVRRVNRNKPMEAIAVPVTRRAMVVGGGIAGIQAALDIANAGVEVILVEKQATIGGRMLQLSETFPTLDCAQCVMSPKMVEVKRHPKVKLMTYSEVKEVSGSVGNFQVKVIKKPTYVDPDKCKLCDECTVVCPVVVPNEYEINLTTRRAIYIPYAQSIPASYTLDESTCLGLNPVVCGKCKDVCEADAISYD